MEETLFGLTLGLASGISPGPLLTLVVTATLRRGFTAGARVAAAPLLTDIPLIALSILVLGQLPVSWRAGIGLIGALVVCTLGVRTWIESRTAHLPGSDDEGAAPRDFWHAVAVNLLNPQAWLFWTAVGAPLLIRTAPTRPWAAVGFLAGFFGLLVGVKLVLAALLARGRHLLTEKGYRRAIAVCAAMLLVLGALLAVHALRDLGLL